MMEKDDGVKKFLIGMLGGAAVGGLLGILFAPKSGQETREKIKEEIEKIKERAGKSFENKNEMMKERTKKILKDMLDRLDE